MTCIVGIAAYNGKVFIGGDSCGSNSYIHTVYIENKKVFIQSDFIIGCCGSYRMIDLLTHSISIEKPRINEEPEKYIRTTFIKNLVQVYKDNGFLETKDGKYINAGNFLLGYKGKLYEFQDDLSILNCPVYGSAIGCGEISAKGSLWTTKKDKNPRERILKALEASEAINIGVKRPFYILNL